MSAIENALRRAHERCAVLASDTANSATPAFTARDLGPSQEAASGDRFSAVLARASAPESGAGGLEWTMSQTAQNSLQFRALANQERAMLHEFRIVAEESRR